MKIYSRERGTQPLIVFLAWTCASRLVDTKQDANLELKQPRRVGGICGQWGKSQPGVVCICIAACACGARDGIFMEIFALQRGPARKNNANNVDLLGTHYFARKFSLSLLLNFWHAEFWTRWDVHDKVKPKSVPAVKKAQKSSHGLKATPCIGDFQYSRH